MFISSKAVLSLAAGATHLWAHHGVQADPTSTASCGDILLTDGMECCDPDMNATGPACCGAKAFDPTLELCTDESTGVLVNRSRALVNQSPCPLSDDGEVGPCEDDETFACVGYKLKEKNGKFVDGQYLQTCVKNTDLRNVSVGGTFSKDKTLSACGCCTADIGILGILAFDSSRLKLDVKRSSKKGSKKDSKKSGSSSMGSMMDDEEAGGCISLSGLEIPSKTKCSPPGNAVDVTKWCKKGKYDCCNNGQEDSPDACSGWKGENVVCQGACRGPGSCDLLGSNTFVGPDSCNGDIACSELAGAAMADIVVVGSSACNAESACQSLGYFAEGSVTVNSDSCNNYFACYALGSRAEVSVFVDSNSCNDKEACIGVGALDGILSVTVDSNSCNNEKACYLLGIEAEGSVSVGGDSCNDFRACNSLGEYAAGSVTVDSDSCNAQDACNQVGRGAEGSVFVGGDSCNDYYACFPFGYKAQGSVTVDSKSCNNEKACYFLGDSAGGSVTVSSDSCNGIQACPYLGLSAPGDVSVAPGSCNDYYACYDLGGYARGSVTVSSDSCNNEKACYELGYYAAGDVFVDANVCNDKSGDESGCYQLGKIDKPVVPNIG